MQHNREPFLKKQTSDLPQIMKQLLFLLNGEQQGVEVGPHCCKKYIETPEQGDRRSVYDLLTELDSHGVSFALTELNSVQTGTDCKINARLACCIIGLRLKNMSPLEELLAHLQNLHWKLKPENLGLENTHHTYGKAEMSVYNARVALVDFLLCLRGSQTEDSDKRLSIGALVKELDFAVKSLTEMFNAKLYNYNRKLPPMGLCSLSKIVIGLLLKTLGDFNVADGKKIDLIEYEKCEEFKLRDARSPEYSQLSDYELKAWMKRANAGPGDTIYFPNRGSFWAFVCVKALLGPILLEGLWNRVPADQVFNGFQPNNEFANCLRILSAVCVLGSALDLYCKSEISTQEFCLREALNKIIDQLDALYSVWWVCKRVVLDFIRNFGDFFSMFGGLGYIMTHGDGYTKDELSVLSRSQLRHLADWGNPEASKNERCPTVRKTLLQKIFAILTEVAEALKEYNLGYGLNQSRFMTAGALLTFIVCMSNNFFTRTPAPGNEVEWFAALGLRIGVAFTVPFLWLGLSGGVFSFMSAPLKSFIYLVSIVPYVINAILVLSPLAYEYIKWVNMLPELYEGTGKLLLAVGSVIVVKTFLAFLEAVKHVPIFLQSLVSSVVEIFHRIWHREASFLLLPLTILLLPLTISLATVLSNIRGAGGECAKWLWLLSDTLKGPMRQHTEFTRPQKMVGHFIGDYAASSVVSAALLYFCKPAYFDMAHIFLAALVPAVANSVLDCCTKRCGKSPFLFPVRREPRSVTGEAYAPAPASALMSV